MATVITVQESGIDWITATSGAALKVARLQCLAERIIDLQVSGGHRRRPWAKWGFMGESARYVSFGRRGREVVLVLSGCAADDHFEEVQAASDHISRLDLAVTVKTEPKLAGVAWRTYGELLKAGPKGRLGATASYTTGTDGGSTTYVGRRISTKFLRLYDKEIESGDEQYTGCWRYELECKNEVAMAAAAWLATKSDRPGAVAATVHEYCRSHGAQPIFTPNQDGLYLRSPRPPTDLIKRVDWLAQSVASSAQEVADCLGTDALLGILGIQNEKKSNDFSEPNSPHGHHAYEDGPPNPIPLDQEDEGC